MSSHIRLILSLKAFMECLQRRVFDAALLRALFQVVFKFLATPKLPVRVRAIPILTKVRGGGWGGGGGWWVAGGGWWGGGFCLLGVVHMLVESLRATHALTRTRSTLIFWAWLDWLGCLVFLLHSWSNLWRALHRRLTGTTPTTPPHPSVQGHSASYSVTTACSCAPWSG